MVLNAPPAPHTGILASHVFLPQTEWHCKVQASRVWHCALVCHMLIWSNAIDVFCRDLQVAAYYSLQVNSSILTTAVALH